MSLPRKIGKYIVLGHLGKGGFSKVKLGEDEVTKERWALKLLKKERIADLKQVDREITAMTKVRHPNVLLMREVDRDAVYTRSDGKREEVILTVLELASGGELFDFLNLTGKFDETLTRTYFNQLVAGLDACHMVGVAHRDLKPENLLLGNNFVLKLADFGLSNVFASGKSSLMYTDCGTPAYQAPEMTGSGYDAAAVDVWAAGVVLFLMIAGFPPYMQQGDWWHNKLTTNRLHLFWAAHIRNAAFSEPIKDLIGRMLCVDPSKRISVAEMKSHPFMAGNRLNDRELGDEMSRRKADIDGTRARRRLEEQQKKRADDIKRATDGHSHMTTGGDLSGETYRSEGGASPDGDELPADAPSLGIAARGAAAGNDDLYGSGMNMSGAPMGWGRYTSSLPGLDNGSLGRLTSFGTSFEPSVNDQLSTDNDIIGATNGAPAAVATSAVTVVEKKEVAAAPSYVEDVSGAIYTKFSSEQTPAALLARVRGILDASGVSLAVQNDKYKIKGKILSSQGNVEFGVQIYQSSIRSAAGNEIAVVEFRRRQGDAMFFYHLFNETLVTMADVVYTPPASSVTIAAAPSTAVAITA